MTKKKKLGKRWSVTLKISAILGEFLARREKGRKEKATDHARRSGWWRENEHRRPQSLGPSASRCWDRRQTGRCARWPIGAPRSDPSARNSRPSPWSGAPCWRWESRARPTGSSSSRLLGRCSWPARCHRTDFRYPSRSSPRGCTATPDAFYRCCPPSLRRKRYSFTIFSNKKKNKTSSSVKSSRLNHDLFLNFPRKSTSSYLSSPTPCFFQIYIPPVFLQFTLCFELFIYFLSLLLFFTKSTLEVCCINNSLVAGQCLANDRERKTVESSIRVQICVSRPKAEPRARNDATKEVEGRFFPDEDVFCHRFTSERREGNKSGRNMERERRRDATLGELSLARERCGCDGSLMLLPPLSRGSAWQPRHSRRSEPPPRHVSISRSRIAPRRRNVTRKRADPRSTDTLFD